MGFKCVCAYLFFFLVFHFDILFCCLLFSRTTALWTGNGRLLNAIWFSGFNYANDWYVYLLPQLWRLFYRGWVDFMQIISRMAPVRDTNTHIEFIFHWTVRWVLSFLINLIHGLSKRCCKMATTIKQKKLKWVWFASTVGSFFYSKQAWHMGFSWLTSSR